MAVAGTLEIQLLANVARLSNDMAQVKGVVGNAMAHVERVVGAAKYALGSLGIGLSAGLFVAFAKSTIDAMDKLNDLSKATGIAVEKLSGLKLAAQQSGSDLDSIAQAVSKLSVNMGKAPEKFEALGISAKDPLKALQQLADVFTRIEDPQLRAAVMAEALGKSWAGAAPLLAEGGRRIGEMVAEGERLSGITKRDAEEADKFNDQLVILNATFERTKVRIVGDMLPGLNAIMKSMQEGAEEGGKFLAVMRGIQTLFTGDDLHKANVEFVQLTNAFLEQQNLIDRAKAAGAGKGLLDSLNVGLDKLKSRLDVIRRFREDIEATQRAQEKAAKPEVTAAQVANTEKLAAAFLGGTDKAKKAIDEIAKHNERMRQLDAKGWVEKIENDIREYEDGLKEMAKDAEAFYREKRRLQDLDNKGWVDAIEAQINEYEDGLRAMAALSKSATETSDGALKTLTEFLDPAKAQSFGDALAGAFGNAGNALGKLAQALDTYGRKEAEIEKMRQESLKILDPIKRKEIEIALNEKSADAQVRAYGDMAGAAAGFFETGSDGYNALMAVSKAFHAVELAGQLAEMVPRGINAILNQGNGDPYSAFARMAAMAAIVAGLGVAIGGGVGGGGGGQTAADRQRAQGAGTVLGDADAKSQSLLNAIKEIEKTDKIGLGYTRDMLDALHAIQDSMANLAALIFRTTGLTTGENFNVSTGTQRNQGSVLMGALGIDDSWFMKWQNTVTMGLAGWLVGLVGKTTTEITDAGLLIFGRLSELLSGQNMQQYINVRSSSSIFGINIGSSNSSQTGPLDPAVVAQFSLIFKGIADSVEAAAKALNVWTPYFREAMENIALDIGAISLKDLKGQELQDALNAIFSSASDTIAHTMIPGFEAFQKVGEGYYETLIRVASTNEYVKNTMDALGMTLGLVGMDGITARLELAELAGGLENFGKITQSYFENFYTAAEQRGNAARNLVAEFSRLGVVMPESAAAFRQLVEAQDLTTAAGREMWAALMALNVPFAEFINSVLGLDGKMHALSDVTAQHASLQDRLDLALGTKTAQQIERAREMAEAIDNLSLSMLQSIYAAEDTKAGVEAARDRRRAEMRVEAQLMEAQGNHAGALALIRALETEGMNAAEIASYDYIQSLLAQIEAINAAARANRELGEGVGKTGGLMVDMRDSVTEALNTEIELRNRLFELTHTESEVLERNRQIRLDELRIMEITGNLVAGTLTSIQEQIYAQEDLNAAMQATTATFQDFFIGSAQWWNQQVQAAQDAADAAAKAAADAAKAAKAWSDHLTEWLNRNALSDMSPLTAQQQLEEARRQYSLALGGTDVGAITRAADALLAADKAVEGFGGGYSALYAAIRDDLAGLADAGPTLTPGESAIVSSVDNLYDEMRDTKETVAKLLERLIESTKDQTSEVAGAVKSGATKQAAATDKAAAIGERR